MPCMVVSYRLSMFLLGVLMPKKLLHLQKAIKIPPAKNFKKVLGMKKGSANNTSAIIPTKISVKITLISKR